MAESSGKIVSNNVNLQPENNSVEISESQEENKTEPVMEPMLLEDYKENVSPSSVENLFKYLKQEGITIDKNVTLVIFIYILMLETGFVPSEFAHVHENSTYDFHYGRLLSMTNAMPTNWKTNAKFVLSFVLLPFPQEVCKITCISVSDDLVINCSMKDEINFSVLIDPALYIVQLNADGTSRIFQNLRDLSQKFKTQVGNPYKTLILENHNLRPSSLQGMPPEIFWNIVKYCDRNTILSLDKTCKYFEALCVKIKTEVQECPENFRRNVRHYCTKYLFMR